MAAIDSETLGGPESPSDGQLMIGETVGAYTIVSELGRGGMGVVYMAEHRHLGRRAAIKFLVREFSERADLLHRFFTEARAASLVEHDGIVRVFDCDVHPSGNAYIVMEYLEGQNLQAFLGAQSQTLAIPDTAALMLRVADALAAAHAKGIVHRDLKPENIIVLANPPGAIKIVDFGIAKLTLAAQNAASRTLSGTLVGTPRYMSPEQAMGSTSIDARADVYSLGCILYEMLSGRPPFTHQSTAELIGAHISQMPPPLDASVPASLRVLVEGMLAKSPDDRPALREEAIPMLQAATGGRPVGHEAVTIRTAALPFGYPVLATAPLPQSSPVMPMYKEDERGSWGWVLFGVVGMAAAVGAAAVWKPWEKLDWLRAPLVATERTPVPVEPRVPAPVPSSRQTGAQPGLQPAEPAVVPPAPAPPATPPPRPRPVASVAKPEAVAPARPAKTVFWPPVRTPPRVAAKTAPRPARKTFPSQLSFASAMETVPKVSLLSEPPGSFVCLPNVSTRVGFTNAGAVELNGDAGKTTFLVYKPGYHIERVAVAPNENGNRRLVTLRPLNEDDLAPPPPCR
jgi:predicted Ser/Thr protein kinase